MIKDQVKARTEENNAGVKDLASTLFGNPSTEQARVNRKNGGKKKAVAGDDEKSASLPRTPKVRKAQDATALLRADHEIINDLFDEYERAKTRSIKNNLASRICAELAIHTQIEEEIFYPAVHEALEDKELVPEAIVEHAACKDLIAEVEGLELDGLIFDAKIKVLFAYVKHHVKEEESQMFAMATDTQLDMKELGARITARKEELVAQRSRRT